MSHDTSQIIGLGILMGGYLTHAKGMFIAYHAWKLLALLGVLGGVHLYRRWTCDCR